MEPVLVFNNSEANSVNGIKGSTRARRIKNCLRIDLDPLSFKYVKDGMIMIKIYLSGSNKCNQENLLKHCSVY